MMKNTCKYFDVRYKRTSRAGYALKGSPWDDNGTGKTNSR